MTANEMMRLLNEMNNVEKNDFLDKLYDEYFDTGLSVEQRVKIARVMDAYENGELVEVNEEY